ncbi:uncharacterized protein BT62DRAFT_252990 [Guyanagaster necrorhizus]|uniref:Uncharacterized protein n=1 Tax=Guyanagaster necrorhizus TaxID=856835 RepID=A0A9P8ARR5_9AGAR|nr:uncharacterized protein BT62DRAFT_252990 [Guyanagaster necrorhizus MCA 3950]KAG7444127.1 hypothetical protein BT62DRAFT_252990 [Guyanagaster necrorhizus MCA 3950]
MPNLLSRFRRRKASLPVTEIADQQPTTPALSSQHEAVLDQKIHPNLAELVEDFPPIFFVPSAPEPSRASTSTARDDGIIPLKPAGRTRRRSSDTPAKQTSIALAKAAGQLEKLPESPTSAHPALLEAADVSHHTQQSPNQGDRTRNDSARDTDDTITTAVPAVIRHHSDTSTVPSTTAVRPLNDLHLSRTRLHPVYIPDASDIAHDIIYSNDGHDPTRSPNSLSASSFQETTDPPYENSSSPTGSGTFGVFTRLTNLVHGSPAISLTQSPNPPSSWSTFGRRDIRSGRSNSQTTDVGSSSRPSSSGTSHSHTPSSTTRSHIGAPDNTSGSAFGSASSPSSGFTFGSHGPGPRALTSPSPPPLPPLDHPAFGTLAEKDNSNAAFRNDGSKDEKTALFSDHGPRPSSSMPAMRSNSQPSSIWLAESSSRPRLQDIFSSPVSSPTTSRRTSRRSTVSRGSNRQRRHRSKSASTSRKRGESGGDRPDIVGQGSTRDALPPSENGNQARENSVSPASFSSLYCSSYYSFLSWGYRLVLVLFFCSLSVQSGV